MKRRSRRASGEESLKAEQTNSNTRDGHGCDDGDSGAEGLVNDQTLERRRWRIHPCEDNFDQAVGGR